MPRLTVTLDEETKELLVTLAGGERKVSAFLTKMLHDINSGELDYTEDRRTVKQMWEETQQSLDRMQERARYMDERIAYMESKLRQAGVTAEDLLAKKTGESQHES